MRCKLHPYANAVGVCAPCLRDRLLALAAERDQAAASDGCCGGDDSSCGSSPRSLALPARRLQLQHDHAAVAGGFPRSVSPYVAHHRRSNACASSTHQPSLLFFRTPQVGPAGRADDEPAAEEIHRKVARRRRSFLAAIFGGGGGRRHAREEEEATGTKEKDPPRRSTSWLSAIVRRKHRPDVAAVSLRPAPAPQPDEEPESPGGSSSTSWWFPSPSPARQHHRRRHGAGPSGDGISGFTVCLSPLVRPSSAGGRRRCQPPDPTSLGDSYRRHASASFGRNTSRKLADMSRFR